MRRSDGNRSLVILYIYYHFISWYVMLTVKPGLRLSIHVPYLICRRRFSYCATSCPPYYSYRLIMTRFLICFYFYFFLMQWNRIRPWRWLWRRPTWPCKVAACPQSRTTARNPKNEENSLYHTHTYIYIAHVDIYYFPISNIYMYKYLDSIHPIPRQVIYIFIYT